MEEEAFLGEFGFELTLEEWRDWRPAEKGEKGMSGKGDKAKGKRQSGQAAVRLCAALMSNNA